ncbi:hypothetical protein NF867_00705 [Solitalea sp. MAHUQ-68]|uniref:Uncharacterized protein n=1 Tax=Solitalea agri TaxID=2953739 RepID=A0A9X2EZN8_9SPHI|nr:hypothetical protein [Solitalea agri]MCO4291380.1 hypothetical protein [Solitalea agri]
MLLSLDILGFKQIVKPENNSHSILLDLYTNVFNLAFGLGQTGGALDPINSEGIPQIKANLNNKKYNFISISDSVICWTEKEACSSFIDLLMGIRALLAISYNFGIPLRGAISYGEMDVISFERNSIGDEKFTNQVIIGNVIVDAHNLEGKQEWSGCVIESKADFYTKNSQTESCSSPIKKCGRVY